MKTVDQLRTWAAQQKRPMIIWRTVTGYGFMWLDIPTRGDLSDCTGTNYFVIRFDDGSKSVEVYNSDCTMSRFFHDVSEVLAFDDCTGNRVEMIVFHGVEYVYQGWAPGELFRYVGKINHYMYEACYPEFDH